MSAKYDLVFSLGNACSCSLALRKAGLQYASFPFDWMIRGPFALRVETLLAGFPSWPGRLCDLELMPGKSNTEHLMCHDRKTDLLFPHDFPLGKTIAESYDGVVAKYRRRIDRLLRLLSTAKRVLAVYVELPGFPETPALELNNGIAELRRGYPGVQMDLLYFFHVPDVAFRDRQDVCIGDGVRKISFDFKERRDGAFLYGADPELVAAAIRAAGIRVRDYRTPDERRAYRLAQRADLMRRMGAKNRWQLFVNRLEYRICRHFAKRLVRKGVTLKL